MKIVSWNVNGIMPCLVNGSLRPLYELAPDLICFQETRTGEHPEAVPGYRHYWNSSERSGYAGVMSAVRKKPLHVDYGMGDLVLDRERSLPQKRSAPWREPVGITPIWRGSRFLGTKYSVLISALEILLFVMNCDVAARKTALKLTWRFSFLIICRKRGFLSSP